MGCGESGFGNVSTSVDMLGNNTPQTLLSNREVIRPSSHFLFQKQITGCDPEGEA